MSSNSQEVMEKRKSPRIETSNLVGYELFNGNMERIEEGNGRTVNLSKTGTLLETDKVLEGTYVMLMTIDLEGKTITIQGRVVHSSFDAPTGRYYTGIEFTGSEDQQNEVIVAFVKAYLRRKHQI